MSGFPAAPLQPTRCPIESVPEQLSPEKRDLLLMEWRTLKQQLEEIKIREREIRDRLSSSSMFGSGKGTHNYELGNGWTLKLTRTENVKVNNCDNAAGQAIIAMSNLGQGSANRASHLFSFDAKLRESTYKELSPEERAIVDPLITRTQGSPKLELIPPKQ